ncbi:deoxyribodipyrimidine photo-lyase (single-stranded DNA-specific) [Vreelandella songnenensis]|uniref:Cryptochrome DASH n=1 Tax=Vreelandella songnenensis TaxID=1176243 RepID=A0A2T0V0G1_9GAMM|nr:DASH family cryptochrome [Halomonas songnenensis]PRY63578.1 deoxyribodipyrimidine photo-lyase (single-stranded DNA-specific) [Halomonas songnenensis]
MNSTIDIVWLQDDLRVADNPLLRFSSRPDQLLCLYVLNQKWLEPAVEGESTPRIGPARLRFLWQSLMELRGELLQLGSDLLVRIGDPAEVVVHVAASLDAREVRVAKHPGFEETRHIDAVSRALPPTTTLKTLEGGCLLDSHELPFELEALPESFSAFRRCIEKNATIPSALPAPFTLPGWPEAPRGFPPLKAVCAQTARWQPDERQGMVYVGGENAAHERMQHYICRQNGPAKYKKTRNGLLGTDFSTRLSTWLARGCLSARQVRDKVLAWEQAHGSDESSQLIIFELLWREYFHLAARLEGARLFGQQALPVPCQAFNVWREGRTGVPFVDAAMIELRQTGWISNRARQNAASFLVKDLNVDWRLGACWFEHCLIDYDVANNWGNWRYIAGVGRDPRQDRYFNVLKQASYYDPKGLYVAYWLPALDSLPHGVERHQPWRSAPAQFAKPYVMPEEWQRWLVPRSELEETDE